MTRLIPALALAPVLTLAGFAQGFRPDVRTLDGIWREPGMPGESPSVRHRITIDGKIAAVSIGKQLLLGSITHGELKGRGGPKDKEPPPTVAIDIVAVYGEGIIGIGKYTGHYLIDEQKLILMYQPVEPMHKQLYTPEDLKLKLAPIRIQLEKVRQ